MHNWREGADFSETLSYLTIFWQSIFTLFPEILPLRVCDIAANTNQLKNAQLEFIDFLERCTQLYMVYIIH